MSMRTVIVLQLGEVGVLGLPVGGRLDGVGGVGDLGGGGLRLLLADDDGDRGLSRLAVRELQQVEVVGGHRGGGGGGASRKTLGVAGEPSRRLERAALLSTPNWIDPIGGGATRFKGQRPGRPLLDRRPARRGPATQKTHTHTRAALDLVRVRVEIGDVTMP